MSETLRFFLLQTSLIAVVLILHTYLGLHIIRRTLIFSDLALDQLAALGVLVGIGLNIQYGSAISYLLAMAAVLFGAVLLAVVKPKSRDIPREAVIGILYMLALVACLLLGDKLQGGANYLTKTLSGSMLWVSWPLVGVTVLVYIFLLLFHYKFRHNFIALAENPKLLKNEKLWDFLFFTTQGIITVLIVPIAGVLLAYVFLMIPAAVAAMFTKKWILAVAIGWLAGFVPCVIGLTGSYYLDLPYGPTLVLCLGIVFICAIILRTLVNRNTSPLRKGCK
ncbi:MAG: metal ABC transporter permease [Sedimentisphaerales bacterium]|nr:metal ABC transporter permease [Sedimentisphaerales bacterium]